MGGERERDRMRRRVREKGSLNFEGCRGPEIAVFTPRNGRIYVRNVGALKPVEYRYVWYLVCGAISVLMCSIREPFGYLSMSTDATGASLV